MWVRCILRYLSRFFSNASGATIIEYALIGMLISLVAVIGLSVLGDGSTGLWGRNSEPLTRAMSGD